MNPKYLKELITANCERMVLMLGEFGLNNVKLSDAENEAMKNLLVAAKAAAEVFRQTDGN